jgi:hypothetical protein
MNVDTNNERAEHCSFVLSVLSIEATMAVRLLQSICIENIRRFARHRLVELCIGLQPLDLPAFVVCRIAKHSQACEHQRVKLAELWKIATRVKHFSCQK